MHDKLSTRMKEFYESRTKQFLPRRTYTIIRIDGKAFHTYTRDLKKPFDIDFIDAMNITAQILCHQIQGAKLAYVQSDEISILLTDFDRLHTHAWFDGNVQKICSVSASIATAAFNQVRLAQQYFNHDKGSDAFLQNLAHFDSRVFTIPSETEVYNYFLWRFQDCVRNSVSSAAQAEFSHKQLHGKNTIGMKIMLKDIDKPWDDLPEGFKNCRLIVKEQYELGTTTRTKWVVKNAKQEFVEQLKELKVIPTID